MKWLIQHFGKIAFGLAALTVVAVLGSNADSQTTARSAYAQPTVAVAAPQTATVKSAPIRLEQGNAAAFAAPTPEAAPNGTYTNVDGNSVPRPYRADTAPAGATAQCRDGSYSFSQHRSGTCSHHGGVSEWL